MADEITLTTKSFVQLARLALSTDAPEAQTMLRRLARQHRADSPAAADALVQLLRVGPTRGASSSAQPVVDPVDVDSRLPLVRREDPVVLRFEPILDEALSGALEQLASEHERSDELYSAGLAPTRTALFVGPPGVGKTLAARWLARRLELPLVVLDLSSVMSSFLGRTGNNVRRVLDHARISDCVLLLDELDAVAKRRDDTSEIGELKRLVTVLLQEIDRWPEGSLLLAASNHSELLDPAVWRRFETVLTFDLPDLLARRAAIRAYLDDEPVADEVEAFLVEVSAGSSLSVLESQVFAARRVALLGDMSLTEAILRMSRSKLDDLPSSDRGRLAARMVASNGLSQRQVSHLTGVSRDTLRKYVNQSRG